MEYSYMHGLALDGPGFEDGALSSSTCVLGSFQQLSNQSLCPALSWSTTDPTLLVNEYPWLSRGRLPHALGGDTHFDSNVQHLNGPGAHGNFHQLNSLDMMATLSGDPLSISADISHWMQVCSLLQDQYYGDALPRLISETRSQQACAYTSSSDCLHEADSSGSSERDRAVTAESGKPCSTNEECNWRNSEALTGNLAGLARMELADESSSAATDGDTMNYPGHGLGLRRLPAAVDSFPRSPVSWMPRPVTETDSSSVAPSVLDRTPTLDPLFLRTTAVQYNSTSTFKRQRACYTLENIPSSTMGQPLIPSLAQTFSTRSEFPNTSLPVTGPKDISVSAKQIVYHKKSAANDQPTPTSRSVGPDVRAHRRQNATSVEPQSVAARLRRNKISDRMKLLENLIPGYKKMDHASMLDEAFDYVKFLQLQVQLLGNGSASPLIQSEILQQQLFKQKLCLLLIHPDPPLKDEECLVLIHPESQLSDENVGEERACRQKLCCDNYL